VTSQIYIDANICIYILEGYPSYRPHIERLTSATAEERLKLFTSELSLAEALVPAYRAGEPARIRTYIRFFAESGLMTLVPTSREIYIRVAFYRAEIGLKTPDAIHVASAVEAGCTEFLTHDHRLRLPKQLGALTLDAFAARWASAP
jgi:predicted nucleic acid-binding protein